MIGRAQFQERLQKWLKRIPWTSASWPTGKVPVYAFITGGLQKHWESTDAKAKEELRVTVNEIFRQADELEEICPVSKLLDPHEAPCYFITRANQNIAEKDAVQTMYQQLNKGLAHLPTASVVTTMLGFEPVAVFGIRRRVSTFTIVANHGITNVGSDLPGNESSNVLNLGSDIIDGFQAANLENFVKVTKAAKAQGKQPLITLKSGPKLSVAAGQSFS